MGMSHLSKLEDWNWCSKGVVFEGIFRGNSIAAFAAWASLSHGQV